MVSRIRSEDGASAVIVAIALLLLFGAGAIAIDLGSMWETKRDLVIDTDAAALAAARLAAEEGCTDDVRQESADFLSRNLGTTIDVDDLAPVCTTTPDLTTPYTVQISFTDQAQQTLSGAIGAEELNVFSSSTAEFNGLATGPLRPIAVCNDHAAIQSALSSPPPSEGLTFIVSMERTWKDPASCGDAGGFWYWMCFDSNCGQSDVNSYFEDGYPGAIDLGSADADKRDWDDPARDEDCDPPPTPRQDVCYTAQGTVGNLATSTEGQKITGLLNQTFSVLVIDKIYPASDPRCSTRPCVHPWGFAYVGLEAVCQRGNHEPQADVHGDATALSKKKCHEEGESNGDIVFAFRLFGVSTGGTPEAFVNFSDPRVELCGVDNDPGSETDRCDRAFSD